MVREEYIFKVPISGTYKMTFSAYTGNNLNYANIRVLKNGPSVSGLMLIIFDGNEADNENNLSYTYGCRI